MERCALSKRFIRTAAGSAWSLTNSPRFRPRTRRRSGPMGMATLNSFLYQRDSFYWDRNACAQAYGDYTKARIYHWLHKSDLNACSGDLWKAPKNRWKNRVWYNYAGQSSSHHCGTNNRPTSRRPGAG